MASDYAVLSLKPDQKNVLIPTALPILCSKKDKAHEPVAN